MRKRTLVLSVVALGLAVGALAAVLMPAPWLFVEPGPPAPAATGSGTRYACPMFCAVLDEMPEDGRCPVCGMDLAPVAAGADLDAHEQWMIGLEPAPLMELPLVHEVRLVGEVDYAENRVAAVVARTAGWLEVLTRRVTWEQVDQGEELFAIYSPELYQAQQEYLVARRRGGVIEKAAARRLELLGLAEEEMARLRESGEPRRRVVYRAPLDGTIVARNALEGAAVKRGEKIYTIADLDRVWMQLEAFERDLTGVMPGMPVTLSLENHPGRDWKGEVAFIDPAVDPRSRTARLRVEMDNPAGEDGIRPFRPGQRVRGTIRVPVAGGEAPSRLALPRSSVLRTGRRSVVYVLYAEQRVETAGDDGGATHTTRDYHLDPTRLPENIGYELVEVEIGPLSQRADAETLEPYYPLIRVVPPPPLPDPETGRDLNANRLRSLEPGHVVALEGAMLLDSQAQLSGRPSLLYPHGRTGGSGGDHDH